MFIVYLLDANLYLFQIRGKGKAGRGSVLPAFLWDIGKQLEDFKQKQTMTRAICTKGIADARFSD